MSLRSVTEDMLKSEPNITGGRLTYSDSHGFFREEKQKETQDLLLFSFPFQKFEICW
jgi:hypothetical protein